MNINNLHINKNDIKAALHTSLPIMVTFVVLGAGFGILMSEHGFGPLWSLLSGIIIFSGTVQFVSVTMLSTGSYIMAAVTALMVAADTFSSAYLVENNGFTRNSCQTNVFV